MTFEVDVAGRSRSVVIEPAGPSRFRVSIDGHPHLVDAVRVGEFGLSLIVDGETGTSREVLVVPAAARGERLVSLDGRTVAVAVDGRRSRRRGAEAAGGAHGEQRIVAPMPGRVLRVLVREGDEVSARQPVVVVEAMKMENELRSPKAGRVKEVGVAPGASVDAGRVLLVIE